MLGKSQLQAIICTSNPAEAKRFYGEVLELPSKGTSLGAEVYDVDGVSLRVSPVPSNRPSEHTVLGFSVRDLDTVATWLLAKGVQFERFPAFSHDAVGIVRIPDGTRVLWFRDPDGNLLSVVQYAS
jgi:catechol 2,3-dioxygenase-like lactoylglutathione lyase family enzyme